MKTNINLKTSWDEVTFGEFVQIDQILHSDTPRDFKMIHILSILSDWSVEEINKMTPKMFTELLKKISFITSVPEEIPKKNQYEINGRIYNLKANITDITTAQYIDYQGIMSQKPTNLSRLVAVFLIPPGHDYNEGYDFEQVAADVDSLPMKDVRAISFFLRRQLSVFILILRDCLNRRMKKQKMKNEQNLLKPILDRFHNMASSLW